MTHNSESAIKAALVANGAIAVIKLVAAIFSGSSAMAAEFKHSVADWANSFFLLYGVRSANRPRDQHYNFGYGKRVFFFSFLAALGMITIGGALSIYGGVSKILHPEPLVYVALNLGVLGASILFESYSLTMALKALCAEAGVAASGPALLVKGARALVRATPSTRFIFFEDSIALLGLLIAAAAVLLVHFTGQVWFDGAASIIIGLILFYVGINLAKDNADIITGESIGPEMTRAIGDFVMEMAGVTDIHALRTMAIGPNAYLLEIIIEANGELPLETSDDLGFTVKKEIKKRFPQIKHASVTVMADNRNRNWPTAFCAALPEDAAAGTCPVEAPKGRPAGTE
ncbi:MAG: cation diffusion facilitator family transporter [Bacillota bacterium]|nr:cation diffusion facilitator family transporter [Bacillota bacterium]